MRGSWAVFGQQTERPWVTLSGSVLSAGPLGGVAFHAESEAHPTRDPALAPIHGDFYRRNVLTHGGEVTGIIDWDEAHIDYAMAELAWAVWELCQTEHGDDLSEPQANDFVTAYSTAAPPLTAEDLRHAIAFIRRRLRVEILYQLHARRCGDAWNDGNQAYFDAEVRAFHNLRERVWRPAVK